MASVNTNKNSRQFVIRVPHDLDERIESFFISQKAHLNGQSIRSRSSLWKAALAEYMDRVEDTK